MLPSVPGTRVHIGIVVALFVVLVLHYVLKRTSVGLRLQVLGANPRAAVHAHVAVARSFLRRELYIKARIQTRFFLFGSASAVDTRN